ncbi:MAG: hypothetical protein AB1730_06500 [Myxococcota bacterium]
MRTSRWLSVVTMLLPGAALACPVCGVPSEQGQGAYLFMTPIMSLLPLALLGGVVAWVVVRVRHADRAEAPAPADEAQATSTPVDRAG